MTHTKYVDIKNKQNVPKLNVLEQVVYNGILLALSIVFIVGLMSIGLYTLKLINTTPFYSIIYK